MMIIGSANLRARLSLAPNAFEWENGGEMVRFF